MPTEGSRTALPTVAELRAVVQPPEVLARPAEHWTATLYLRRVSPYLTRLLLRAGLSANQVTGLMIATGVLAGLALLVPGPAGVVLAVVLAQAQMLWDCCDGEVARWNRTSSAVGVFLDKVGHYTAELSIAVCLGFRLAGDEDLLSNILLGDPGPLGDRGVALGLALAVLLVLNRALNDMVHAARAAAGLAPLGPSASAASVPRRAGVARLRSAARFVPVHRLLHSVELTLLVAAAALAAALTGLPWVVALTLALVAGSAVVVVGHVVAIVTSGRLRA